MNPEDNRFGRMHRIAKEEQYHGERCYRMSKGAARQSHKSKHSHIVVLSWTFLLALLTIGSFIGMMVFLLGGDRGGQAGTSFGADFHGENQSLSTPSRMTPPAIEEALEIAKRAVDVNDEAGLAALFRVSNTPTDQMLEGTSIYSKFLEFYGYFGTLNA